MSYPPYGQPNPGYPPQPGGMQYPGHQQQGVTPYQGGYPSGYPPQQGGGYPPQQGGGYPPQQAGGYPQPGSGYPPQQQSSGGYPPYGGTQGPGQSPYPPQPGYGQQQPPAQQYPNQPYGGGQGYTPTPPAGYPSQQPSGQYPPAQHGQQYPNYPSTQPTNYPPQQQGGYPAGQQSSGYPQQQPGGGYPSQQPGSYPAAGGYGSQPTAGYGAGYPQNVGIGAGYGAGANVYQTGQQTVANLTPIMSSMTRFEGSVHPAPNFNPNQDADALKKAMRGFGCDDKAVMNILCYRSNAQRQQIRQMFKTMYGKDLISELVSELKGNFEDLIVALLYTPEEFDARELQYAMAGIGTKESTLIEIMVTRTNAEINAIKAAFRRLYGRELEQALANETSGHFKRLLVSLTVGGRDESSYTDPGRAAAQAKELYQAGEKQWGTNESVFNATMVATNPAQLQLVFQEYHKLTGHDIEQAVKSEFSGDIEDGLLTVVKCAKNQPAYFAERAYQAMRGMGTHDRMLIRVIVSRCEKDMVQIRQEYQRMYRTTLENAIAGDTSGKYKDGLIALVKGR